MSKKKNKIGNITLVRNVMKETRFATREQPDYKGKLTIEGEDFECALWVNNDIHQVPLHLSGQITSEEKQEKTDT